MSLTAGNLFISSYNNQDYDSSTDFAITLAVPVTKATRLRLLGATIPNLFMPFGANDRFWVFSVNGISYQMNFPINLRWATIADFLSYVNTTLFPGASTYPAGTPAAVPATLSYSASTNKLTLTATTPGQVITMPGWAWNNSSGTAVSFNANYRLGWTSVVDVSGTTTLTADGFPNVFNRTNVVYVTTNICTDSNNDANIGNVLGRIPMTSGWGSLVNYENVHSDFSSPVFTPNIKEIRIRLLDEDYQLLSNPNNAYFNVVLGIEY
jgi:hypothetical protein